MKHDSEGLAQIHAYFKLLATVQWFKRFLQCEKQCFKTRISRNIVATATGQSALTSLKNALLLRMPQKMPSRFTKALFT